MSLTLGILVGYSRVYLAHHFLIDVFAGAVLGLLFGSLSYLWYNKYGATISGLFILKSNNKPEVRVSNHPSLQN
jgi:undecaprenyl-diphosphatase